MPHGHQGGADRRPPTGGSVTSRWRPPSLAALAGFVGCVALAHLSSMLLVLPTPHQQIIWLPGGLVIAALIATQWTAWPWQITAATATSATICLIVSGDPLRTSIGLSATMAGIVAAALLLRSLLGRQPDLTQPRVLLPLFGLGAILAPGISALGVTLWLSLAGAATPVRDAALGFLGDALANGVTLPLTLVVIWRHGVIWRLLRSGWLPRCFLLAQSALALALFTQNSYPLLFLPLAPLLLLTVLFGFAFGMLGLGVTMLIALVATMHNHGPVAINPATSIDVRLIILQVFLLLAQVKQSLVASILERRDRLNARRAHELGRLVDSETQFRHYFESVTDGLMVLVPDVDRRLRYHQVSANAAKLLGHTKEELLGQNPFDVLAQDAAVLLDRELRSCMETGAVSRFSLTLMVNGEQRVADVICSPLRAAPDSDSASETLIDGNAADAGNAGMHGVIAYLRDVTATHQSSRLLDNQTRELRKSLESQSALFENAPDGLIVVHVEYTADNEVEGLYFLALSPSCARIIGIPVADLLGRRVRDGLAPPLGAIMERDYQLGLHSVGPISRSATWHLPAGRRDLETVIVPLRDPTTGQVDRIIACLRDVTERNELTELLRQSQKLEAIGRVAAGVAHDFNNILQGLIGSLEMLSDEMPPGSSMEQHIRVAMHSADRGAYLTHHLLSYARKQTLQSRIVTVGALLEDLRELLSRAVGPLVRLDYDLHQPEAKLRLDVTQFTTAMLNLGVNASHAMPRGGVLSIKSDLLEVPAGEDLPAGTYVAVTVADTGKGMDADTRARAFEPFYTTKGNRGTGLGLAMVQGFTRQSGGDVRIESTPGQGTRIEILLPQAVPGEMETAKRRPHEAHLPKQNRTGRILLVDDMSDVLVTAGAFLEAAGFTVDRCGSGDSAVERLVNTDFDVLITDYAMPGLHGADLIEQARFYRPGLPAILITGYPGFEVYAGEHPPALVLAKPFRRAELLAAVASLLHPSAAQVDPSRAETPHG